MRVVGVLQGRLYTDSYKFRWYVVVLGNGDTAYVQTKKLKPADLNNVFSLENDCFLSIEPKDVQARLEEISPYERSERKRKDALLAKFERDRLLREEQSRLSTEQFRTRLAEIDRRSKLPGVRIGMSATKVVNETRWGAPEKINRTTARQGVREQWVYPGGRYLYFENDRLIVVQD